MFGIKCSQLATVRLYLCIKRSQVTTAQGRESASLDLSTPPPPSRAPPGTRPSKILSLTCPKSETWAKKRDGRSALVIP